jgi:hypothetical protein
VKPFDPHRFDSKQCRVELDEFKALLISHSTLEEAKHVRPFFERRAHLSAFFGSYISDIITYDRIAHQLVLAGDFACDLAVGDPKRLAYCLVEFEDATENSVFRKNGQKATREWAPRFEHGYSQIVDWFFKLDDIKQTSEFEHLFGRNATYYGILIAGRRQFLVASEQERLVWRSRKVLVDSRRVYCLTYDDLYEDLNDCWQNYDPAFQTNL